MAASTRSPTEGSSCSGDLYTLHEMFRIIGDQLTQKDIRTLKSMYTNVFTCDMLSKIKDGYSVFLALEKLFWVDDTNFRHVLEMLKCVTRHDLIHLVTLRKPRPAYADPVDEYLENTATSNTIIPFKRSYDHMESSNETSSIGQASGSGQAGGSGHSGSASASTARIQLQSASASLAPSPAKRRKTRFSRRKIKGKSEKVNGSSCHLEDTAPMAEIKKKVTCDIRLRVRAEYCHHDSALEGNVHSNKPNLIERQFEKFLQANTILKSRDLGSIICDIKFSELTYLDAFWRDYINGALLEALKGVFITESLKQAVGHEAIKLLVNVDEDDYEKGRLKLLENLTD